MTTLKALGAAVYEEALEVPAEVGGLDRPPVKKAPAALPGRAA